MQFYSSVTGKKIFSVGFVDADSMVSPEIARAILTSLAQCGFAEAIQVNFEDGRQVRAADLPLRSVFPTPVVHLRETTRVVNSKSGGSRG